MFRLLAFESSLRECYFFLQTFTGQRNERKLLLNKILIVVSYKARAEKKRVCDEKKKKQRRRGEIRRGNKCEHTVASEISCHCFKGKSNCFIN